MKRGADVRPGVAAGEARGAGRRGLSEGEWAHTGRRAPRVRGERRARWRGPGDAALRAGRGGSGSGPGRGWVGLRVWAGVLGFWVPFLFLFLFYF